MAQITLFDSKGNPIKKEDKNGTGWIPSHEYILEQFYRGKATKEEYDMALAKYLEDEKKK